VFDSFEFDIETQYIVFFARREEKQIAKKYLSGPGSTLFLKRPGEILRVMSNPLTGRNRFYIYITRGNRKTGA